MFINLTSLTSLHQPTNERNLPQRQVALHDIGHKEQQQNVPYTIFDYYSKYR